MQTFWLSPTSFVTGDPSLRISYPSVSHPNTIVTCTEPGDLKWISMGLPLPPNVSVEEIIICYQVSNPENFISQVRLIEINTPDKAFVRHDDPTDLKSTNPMRYSSKVSGLIPTAALILSLRLNFQNTKDKIILGAVGIKITYMAEFIGTLLGLRTLIPGVVPCVAVLEYHAAGDGGGGCFFWDADSTMPDNGGTIIAPASGTAGRWRMVPTIAVSVKQFGAKGDGSTLLILRLSIGH